MSVILKFILFIYDAYKKKDKNICRSVYLFVLTILRNSWTDFDRIIRRIFIGFFYFCKKIWIPRKKYKSLL